MAQALDTEGVKSGLSTRVFALPVKKFIQLSGWNSSHLPAENLKIFKGRCLYIFVAILMENTVDPLLYLPLLAAFTIVNIPYTLWCMKNTLHCVVLLIFHFYFSMLPCYYDDA